MKVFFFGIVEKKRSLWIYGENLIKSLKKKSKVVDCRKIYEWASRIRTTFSQFWYNIIPHRLKDFNNWDVILHSHSSFIFSPIWCLKRSIIVVHDLVLFDDDYYDWRPIFVKPLKYWNKTIWRRLYKRMLYKCLWIVAISQATKDDIIGKFWKNLEKKVEVVYNGIDLSVFKPALKKEKPDNLKDQYICYIGSEMDRKNLKNIIAWFSIVKKEFPNLKLIKAPKDNTLDREKTLKYINDNNLKVWEDVIFIDEYLPIENLIELYQYAEVFVFPSLKEGFWFPILEAQACWTPVITTNYNPMKELVTYKEMTVDPLSPEDIAEKIIKILKNPNLRESMVKDWLKNSSNFTRDNTAQNMLNFIEKYNSK